MSTVIKGGTIVAADRTYEADILIEGEKIAAIGENLKGDKTVDAEGAYIMPGGIDPHTHLEMPFMGTTAAETWESGTFAALSGGTTLVVDFVIPGPDGMIAALDDWEGKAKRQASSDYSLHMCVNGWSKKHFDEMPKVIERGINTFKHFMAYKGALMVNDDEMFASFQRCAALGALPLVHAENGDIVAALQQKYLAEGIAGPEAHAYSRPPEVEGEATNRAIMIADAAGVPVYIVHTSSEQAHEAIRRARQKGMRVYGEPLIQHLTLDETEYFNKRLGLCGAPRDEPALPRQEPSGFAVGRPCRRVAAGGGDRPLRLHRRAEAFWPQGLHQDSQWHRRARGPALGAVDQGRRDRPADAERVRRGDLDQHRPHPQHLSAEGRDPAGLRRRPRGVGPKAVEDHLGRQPEVDHRLQRVRRLQGQRPAALHAVARRGGVVATARTTSRSPGRGKLVKRKPFPAVNKALSTWKELTAPRGDHALGGAHADRRVIGWATVALPLIRLPAPSPRKTGRRAMSASIAGWRTSPRSTGRRSGSG